MAKLVILGTAHGHIFGMAECARASKKLELAGVWDDDATRRKTAAEKMGIPEIKTLEEALAMKPAVAMTTAVPGTRVSIAEQCAAAKVPILVDKPLAVTRDALERIIAAQKKSGTPVITYYPYRGDPHMQAAKAMLDSGAIGKLVRIFSAGPHKINASQRPYWHWTAEDNGGALIDIGSHHIDNCCWLANGSPEWVSAIHANFDQPSHGGFQDFAQAQLRFASGAFAHVEVDWLNPPSMRNFGDTRVWIQGTHGKIEIRHGDESLAHFWTDQVAQQPLDPGDRPSIDGWTTLLLEDLAAGGKGFIPQEEVWRTSRATFDAFESAQHDGAPVVTGLRN